MKKLLIIFIILTLAVTVPLWLSSDNQARLKVDNVVLVTIDTLRSDHVSTYGYLRKTTPFIDSLASSGVKFNKAFTACSHTAPSHATIFTSLYPFEHGLLVNSQTLREDLFTIQDLATNTGLKPAAFSAVRFMRGKVGFDALDKKFNVPHTPKEGGKRKFYWYQNAEQIVSRVKKWLNLEAASNNFLIWAHFYDVHQWRKKGNIPDDYLEAVRSEPAERLLSFVTEKHNTPESFFGSRAGMFEAMNGYDARLMYVDDQLSDLYSFMNKQELNENTLWIITSDHGEGIGNHNLAGHGEYIYNEQLKIPLIIHHPQIKLPQQEVKHIVETVDILPTLAELLSYEKLDKLNIRGSSLVPLMFGEDIDKQEFAFAQRRPKDQISFRKRWEDGDLFALQNPAAKYIYHSKNDDEFYNLTEDPFEMKNIINSDSSEKLALKDRLLQTISEPKSSAANMSSEIQMDKDTLRELEALGYL